MRLILLERKVEDEISLRALRKCSRWLQSISVRSGHLREEVVELRTRLKVIGGGVGGPSAAVGQDCLKSAACRG